MNALMDDFRERIYELLAEHSIIIFYGAGQLENAKTHFEFLTEFEFLSLYRLQDNLKLIRGLPEILDSRHVLVEGLEENAELFQRLCEQHTASQQLAGDANKCILISMQTRQSVKRILGKNAEGVHFEKITNPALEEMPIQYQQLPLWQVVLEKYHEEKCVSGYDYTHRYEAKEQDFYCKRFIDLVCWKEIRGDSKTKFYLFMYICAVQSTGVINYSAIARQCNITSNTAKYWTAVLEDYEVITLIKPYIHGYSKRLLAGSKLVFNNTALLCYLLQLNLDEVLNSKTTRVKIFANWVMSEMIKLKSNRTINCDAKEIYYWCDSKGRHADLIISTPKLEKEERFCALSIDAMGTENDDGKVKDLIYLDKIAKGACSKLVLIHEGGRSNFKNLVSFVSWRNLQTVFADGVVS